MKKYVLLIFFVSIITFGQGKESKIDELLSKYNEYGLFNGSALIAEKGEVILKNGYGFANMEFSVPNKSNTKFRIGSISKQFTATIILQLVEEGKISLDGKITDYLPDYRKDTGDRVTIHQLLNHTSGILSYTNIPHVWPDSLRNHYTQDYFIKHFHSNDFEFDPGTQYKYNNTGYYLLGVIAEKVTGKSYQDLIKERILDKVGMNDTDAEFDEKFVPNEAQGYMKRGDIFYRDEYIYMPNAMGAGSLYSTVEDLYKWDRALLTENILSNKLKQKMFTPYLQNYGYGWIIQKQVDEQTGDTVKAYVHGGGINGFQTLEIRAVDKDRFIAIFSNAGASPFGEIVQKIGKILDGKEYNFPKKPIGQFLKEVIADEGIDAAIETYKELKKSEASTFDFSESHLNNLGYTLLNSNRINDAIKIFQLNIDSFPKSGNVYDSMAEALFKKGDKENAEKFYRKSLEINPANANAEKMLEKMGVKYETESIVVPEKVLSTYNGEYKLMENFIITVRTNGKQIFAKATGQPEFEIFPKSDSTFYYKVVNAQIEFVTESGKVQKLILTQNGRNLSASKIK